MLEHDYINQRHCKNCKKKYDNEYNRINRKKRNAYRKKWYQEHPEKELSADLKHYYGISLETYNKILSEQNYVCAICGRVNKSRRLHIDHNHLTGKIRGLLCASCNRGIGLLKDNADILYKAIKYLEKRNNI